MVLHYKEETLFILVVQQKIKLKQFSITIVMDIQAGKFLPKLQGAFKK